MEFNRAYLGLLMHIKSCLENACHKSIPCKIYIVAMHKIHRRLAKSVITLKEQFMFSNLEKLSSASKAQLESQLEVANGLAHKVVAAGEKTIALNTAAAKSCLEESNAMVKELFSLKDPQALFALLTAQGKQSADKATAYARQLSETISGVNADFTQAAEAQIADSKSKVIALMDEATKSAPAGSEKAVDMLKSVIGNANASYEQLSKSAKQAVEAVEAQVAKASVQFSDAVKKVA
jgi:phasin family protein